MISARLSDVINPKFRDLHKKVKEHKYLRYVLKGGRGSGKSFAISVELILDLIKNPISILCVRKVANTLYESVYEQLKEAVEVLGVSSFFHFGKSPLKITYLPRGNFIIFRGADDPLKIKSIKVSKFPIATLWVEELAEFRSEEEISTIENSVLRAELDGGLTYKIFYSYNPPKRKQSWVNKKFESHLIAKNTYIDHSTYEDNPYISKVFIDEALHVKKTKPLRYEWEYMGKAIGSGVVPFDNLVFEDIDDEKLRSFDNIRQGIDWGYATDPVAMVRLNYDKLRRRIYIFDEIYGVKISNRQLVKMIKKKAFDDVRVFADSAEPKSISEVKGYGINIFPAKKGAGSVEFGEKWLDDLEAIIIDPKRCPNTAREFESIDYQTDRFGQVMARLEDKNNHTIDAVRYALVNDMVERKIKFVDKNMLF